MCSKCKTIRRCLCKCIDLHPTGARRGIRGRKAETVCGRCKHRVVV